MGWNSGDKMSKDDAKVMGYFAIHLPQDVLCDGDACIIAGSESAMNRYIEAASVPNAVFQVKKTRFGDVLKGLLRGGAYSFDEESYGRFLPLANKNGLNLKEEDFPPTETGRHFVVVGRSAT
jgi:hypothetical protein